jgi:hypothetical protein
MRARLRRSDRPDRIFDAVLDVAKAAGLVGRKRVLDSTALYDAVATQDTVTMIRSSIRGLLRAADDALAAELRGALKRDDDYVAGGKPACDWNDKTAREALVDALARDAYAVLAVLHDRKLAHEVQEAAKLVATVVGQDLEEGQDDVFRIAHRVAPDRIISTVDPEARHGHKTAARGFDGYKGHVAIDPDSEIITNTKVTAANDSDGSVAKELLEDVLASASPSAEATANPQAQKAEPPAADPSRDLAAADPVEVYGDASYGTGEILEHLDGRAVPNVKVQAPSAPADHFSKGEFEIDLGRNTVRCPADVLVQIRALPSGAVAEFGPHCATCPLRAQCTASKSGRTIKIHKHERLLQRERVRQRDPGWQANYKATRPKVERKQAHMMRRKHGGRRARMRGRVRIGQDFALLAAATNLQRLAVLLPQRPS